MTTTDTVVAVLLADGWHHIVPGSFQVAQLSFGTGADPGVPGYRFEEADTASPYGPATLAGPLTALLAVRQAATSRHHRRPGLTAPPHRKPPEPTSPATAVDQATPGPALRITRSRSRPQVTDLASPGPARSSIISAS